MLGIDLTKGIGSQPPRVYAVLYLLMIPAFAFVYWFFLSASFYAPYARFEGAASYDATRVGQIIDEAIHRDLGNKLPLVGSRQMISFNIKELLPGDGSQLKFKIVVGLAGEKDRGDFLIDIPVFIQAGEQLERYGWTWPNDDHGTHVFIRAVDIDKRSGPEGGLSPLGRSVYEKLLPAVYFENVHGVSLRYEENETLNSLLNGFSGDPTKISGGFWRMAYFSTTVITTIGFGDIVPMTSLARFLVAFEGILGIVMAGLFVNAAMREKRNQT